MTKKEQTEQALTPQELEDQANAILAAAEQEETERKDAEQKAVRNAPLDEKLIAGTYQNGTEYTTPTAAARAVGGGSHSGLSRAALDLRHMKMKECDAQSPPT